MPLAELRDARSANWIPILLGQGFGLACGLVGVRLISALVPPVAMGDYGLFLALTPVGPLLTHAGLVKHANRHWALATDRRDYLRSLIRVSLAPMIVLTIAVAIFGLAGQMGGWHAAAIVFTVCLWLANIAGAYALIFQSALQGAGRYWADFGIMIVSSATRTFFPLLAVLAAGATARVLAGGFALSTLTIALTACFMIWSLSGASPATGAPPPRPMWGHYQWAFALAGALAVLTNGLNRWIGAWLFDAHTLGVFMLAMNISFVLPNVLSAACWQFSFPQLVAAAQRGDAAGLSRRLVATTSLFLVLSAGAGATLAFILPWLPGTLIDHSYAGALPFVLPLFGFGTALGLAYFFQHAMLAAHAPRRALKIALASSLVLTVGSIGAAMISPRTFITWLAVSPLVVLITAGVFTRNQLRQTMKAQNELRLATNNGAH